MDKAENRDAIAFDAYRLGKSPLSLERDGAAVAIRLQALKLLWLLADKAGNLVTQDDIRRCLWSERHVDFARGTHLLIREIRHALNDSVDNPAFVETIPRQGYRFIADTQRIKSRLASGADAPVSGPARLFAFFRTSPGPSIAAATLVIAALAGFMVLRAPETEAQYSPAREAYLKAEYLLDKGGAENAQKSAVLFEEALALDPAFAPAQSGLAEIAIMSGNFGEAETHARAALSADPDLAAAHLNLGMIAALRDWDWREAQSRTDKAIALDPQSAKAFGARAHLLTILGRSEEAVQAANRAHELDPVSALIKTDSGWYHYYAGDFGAASQICAQAAALAPEVSAGAYCIYKSALMAGDIAGAAKGAAQLVVFWNNDADLIEILNKNPTAESLGAFDQQRLARINRLLAEENFSAPALAAAFAEMGDYETAAIKLEEAAQQHAAMLPLYLRDPVFEPLHQDPRYLAALRATAIDQVETM